MTIRPNTLLVSWYEGVCHKVSVEENLITTSKGVYSIKRGVCSVEV